jgi:hypothetical protein
MISIAMKVLKTLGELMDLTSWPSNFFADYNMGEIKDFLIMGLEMR